MNDLLIITGGSAGIGLATVDRFLQQGYAVANVSRSPCPSKGTVSIQADLTQPTFADTVGHALASTLPGGQKRRIALVHNALGSWFDSVESATTERFEQMLRMSLCAPLALNQLLIPHMDVGSSIIYIGSTLSTKAVPNSFSYITAKHALVGMMRATSQDLSGRGIHSACVCPGPTDTPMLRSLFNATNLDRFREATSVRRLIQPREIGDVIFMAATSPVLNGAIIDASCLG